jgi:hypothetical protein
LKKNPSYLLLTVLLASAVASCGGGSSGSAPGSSIAPPMQLVSTTLSTNVSFLALSVNNVGQSANLTGNARTITLTNTGSATATAVNYVPSRALPAGTTISPASCGDMQPTAICILTVTPGATPSATPGDRSPTPLALIIAGTNTNTLAPTVDVLTFGSVYQSGFVFAIDDTSPVNGGVGGKVAALAEQALGYPNGIRWSSDSAGNPALDNIAGISEVSTNGPNSCSGKTDGACNTRIIVAFYSNQSVTPQSYAAGLCTAAIGGYLDWYLPAICEMGYDNAGFNAGCGSSSSPVTQNIQSSLMDNPVTDISAGYYWSSTEYSPRPDIFAFLQNLQIGGLPPGQWAAYKDNPIGVRCARALTL